VANLADLGKAGNLLLNTEKKDMYGFGMQGLPQR
jgi:hypothetical protein